MQIQSKFVTLRKIAAGAVMACLLMLPVGCDVEEEATVTLSVNPQTGTVTATITYREQLLMLAAWISGTDLSSLDPSQAILNYSVSNATITSTNGLVTVTLTDHNTGTIVGQQNFQYVANGNGLFVQDPSAVSSWLNQFTSYSNLDVTVSAATDMQATSAGTATATSNAMYRGVTYASASASWAGTPPGGGGTCHTRFCPNQ